MQLEAIYIGEDEKIHDVVACGPVDIVKPPQGGKVIFAGIRATNLDGCGLKLDVALRDPESRGILGGEIRTVNLTPMADRPGWGQSSGEGNLAEFGFGDFANMAVCPNFTGRDVQRLDGLLDIHVTDKAGRKGSLAVHVVPRCAQKTEAALAECECTCEANTTLDKCKNVVSWDAGADTGACPAIFDAMPPPDGGG